MKGKSGGAWFPTIALLVLLSSCAAGRGTGSTGIDNTAERGKAFAIPQKHDSGLSREARLGKVSYEYYCALCHGVTGNADGFNAYNLHIPPARHTDPILMGTLSDTQIQRVIKEGGGALGRSPQMPPWGGVLSDREIADLTAFIRTLPVATKNTKE